MKTKPFLTAILIGSAVAMTTVGCSHLGDKSAGEIVDDATLVTKVKAKFVDDPIVKAMDIKVNAFQGVVQLSGFANSMAEVDQAGRIARNTSGVKGVRNDIRLASAK